MIASLTIQAAARGDSTYLKNMYFSPPLKLADVTENRLEKFLHLMQMSSSPGILDGDHYTINIEIQDNCHLQLHTQSYQRLFSMTHGASQEMQVQVGENSTFVYLPHPCVPQENSIFNVVNTIHLSSGATLIWGEVVTCGRKLNGEIFRFSKYHSKTSVFLHNKLIIRENMRLLPATENLLETGMLEGFTHQANLIFQSGKLENAPLIIKVMEILEAEAGIIFGVTSGLESAILLRILGNKSEQLHACLKKISNVLLEESSLCPANYKFY